MKYFNRKKLLQSESYTSIYQPMLDKMSLEVNHFFDHFSDDPKKQSYWGHHYFCKDDGGLLIFDLEKPYEHECSICHKVFKSELYHGVWVYNYRNQVAMNVWKSAILFKLTGTQRYLDYIKKMIQFYGKRYLEFELHNKEGHVFNDLESAEWGCGRIMPQGLNESIFMIRLFNGFEIVKKNLTLSEIDTIKSMAKHVYQMIKPQINKIHNISCWYNSAAAVMGMFIGDQSMVDEAFLGEYGIEQQLSKGVTLDNFWFEGSIHYNFFTLEGIINSMVYAQVYDYKLSSFMKKTVKKMLISAYQYAFDNHVLPNPNDGWPNINLKTYGYIYDMATKVFKESSTVGMINKNISNGALPRMELPLSRPYYYKETSLERLTLIPDINLSKFKEIHAKAHNFTNSQFAILRKNEMNLFLKYGHNGPSHAHPDKMSIEVLVGNQLLTRDLSNAGYGSNLCNEWHRMSTSHSTVVINGENQVSMRQGQTIRFRKDYIKAKTTDVYRDMSIDMDHLMTSMNIDEVIKYLMTYLSYTKSEAKAVINDKVDLSESIQKAVSKRPIVDYTRSIRLLEKGFKDVFSVESDKEVNIDYFFHSEFELMTTLKSKKEAIGFERFGYEHIKDVLALIPDHSKVELYWRKGEQVLKSTIELEDGATLYHMKTLDNPVNHLRDTIMIRKKAQHATFKIQWQIVEGKYDEIN